MVDGRLVRSVLAGPKECDPVSQCLNAINQMLERHGNTVHFRWIGLSFVAIGSCHAKTVANCQEATLECPVVMHALRERNTSAKESEADRAISSRLVSLNILLVMAPPSLSAQLQSQFDMPNIVYLFDVHRHRDTSPSFSKDEWTRSLIRHYSLLSA
jgi:hypothetical protein